MMVLILGVETSTQEGSVALWDQQSGSILSETVFPDEPSHARDIVPAIDQTFSDCNLCKDDIQAVAVSQGPGSFTGLRVGITCAKTIAYVLKWKCLGVSSLQVLAYTCPPSQYKDRNVCVIRDARRSAVYGNLFMSDGENWIDQTGVVLASPSELVDTIPENSTLLGNGVDAYPDIFRSERFCVHDTTQPRPQAGTVAQIGAQLLAQQKDIPPIELNPRYYRKTAAEDSLSQ